MPKFQQPAQEPGQGVGGRAGGHRGALVAQTDRWHWRSGTGSLGAEAATINPGPGLRRRQVSNRRGKRPGEIAPSAPLQLLINVFISK